MWAFISSLAAVVAVIIAYLQWMPAQTKVALDIHATQKAAVRRLQPIGDFVHTITFDNGKEFAAHQDIAHALKTKIFFATPYHAWERGLNENTNGLIRDFFPKGTDFSTISSAEVAKVERLLNARPRKSLGFRSPQEVFHSLAYS
jgi:transposase, IS30 family